MSKVDPVLVKRKGMKVAVSNISPLMSSPTFKCKKWNRLYGIDGACIKMAARSAVNPRIMNFPCCLNTLVYKAATLF